MTATFEQITQGRPTHLDVPCKAWGCDVRLQRLSGPDKLDIVELSETLDKDDQGNVLDKKAGYVFGLELLSRSIVDDQGNLQFATPLRLHWLSGEIGACSELLGPATQLNNLGPDDDDEVEQKKTDSTGPQLADLPSGSV